MVGQWQCAATAAVLGTMVGQWQCEATAAVLAEPSPGKGIRWQHSSPICGCPDPARVHKLTVQTGSQ
jgi:hypothetical protein